MAINIFSGSSSPKRGAANAASNSDRAKAAQSVLSTPSSTSNSGSTAVSNKGTLGKVGSFIGKAADTVSKFLPGIGGTIAKGVAGIFNDPEWWQQVPGEALTVNETLRVAKYGTRTLNAGTAKYEADVAQLRAAILEIHSVPMPTEAQSYQPCINVTELETTQYLMPAIRRAVNAVPLQDAASYSKALESAATLYAIWRTLKKCDYMMKHGQTYLASMNEATFPIFQNENAAWLQSTINRLEEYLRANVRLPHTLCEYLAWRFGRVYKSNSSAKAALVVYQVLPLTAKPSQYDAIIRQFMTQVSSTPEVQKANSDMYNTYFDHDFMVEIRDDTQFKYDMKEFMLRLNSQVEREKSEVLGTIVPIDSSIDNPTTFMASTVSSVGRQQGEVEVLFPVYGYRVYVVAPLVQESGSAQLFYSAMKFMWKNPSDAYTETTVVSDGCVWSYHDLRTHTLFMNPTDGTGNTWQLTNYAADTLFSLFLAKSVDLYNIGIYVPMGYYDKMTGGPASAKVYLADVSALSIDAGAPTLDIIGTEHVYAFANLVDIDRKTSMSYKTAEKLVAKDVANLVDSLDVATVAATPAVSKKTVV